MTWKPDLSTREEIGGFVSDLLSTLPDQLGIDEVIAGCQVLTVPAGAPPKYLNVALGGDAGPPQTGYTQAVLYRGGITGLAVGDYVTVIHLREGNRYEVLGPGGAAGAAVDPAPADAEYVTMALDATLTDERVLTAGDWMALTDGGAGGLATLNFEPDKPVVVSAGGVLAEYATIQAAITAAADCETVLVPPGTYAEDITLKDGVCVKGFGPRDKIRITGDEDIVTTASDGWLENVTIVMTDPDAGASSAVHVVHNGTCNIRQITIIGTQSADLVIRGIQGTGAGTGTLVADDIIIDISSTGNLAAYGISLNLGSYGLEMKNFKITVDTSNVGAAAHALGIFQASSCTIKATEGWLDVTNSGGGATATDLSGTITYSEIVDTSDDTLFGQNVWLLDGNSIGIDGNERLTFNAAGNATFVGVTSVVVPNGAWVGADANASWMFDTTNSDVTTLDKVGIGTRVPGNLVHAYSATTAVIEIEGFADNAFLYLNSATDAGAGEESGIFFQHNSVNRFELFSTGVAGAANLYIYDFARAATQFALIGNGDMTLMGGGGSVGIGAAPGYKLDIVDAATHTVLALRTYSATDAHDPHLYFMKSHHNTLGTLAATTDGDYLGIIEFYGVDTAPGWAHGAYIYAIQRGAAGASYVETDLIFQTYSATAVNTNQLYLDGGTGDVGVGVAPAYRLDVLDDNPGGFVANFFNDGDNVNRHVLWLQGGADLGTTAGVTYYIYAADGDGHPTGYIYTLNGVFTFADASDETRKTNIKDTRIVGLDIINGLKVRDYNWKKNPTGPVMTSFVAQEALKIYPGMISEALDGTLMTSRTMLIPVMVKAIQEQQIQIERLQKQYEKGRTK